MIAAIRLAVILGSSVLLCGELQAQSAPRPGPSPSSDAWKKIAFAFRPPPALAGDLGQYRSPLVFDDGRPVAKPEDWQRRRQEILKFWQGALGPWPPLIEKPVVETLETIPRDGFTQKKVRIEAAAGLKINGYLLIPQGTAPRPAVLVVYYEPETGAGLGQGKLRDFAYQLARRGFVTLSIGWPTDYTARQSAARQPLSSLAFFEHFLK